MASAVKLAALANRLPSRSSAPASSVLEKSTDPADWFPYSDALCARGIVGAYTSGHLDKLELIERGQAMGSE